jgi:hypothetical protein
MNQITYISPQLRTYNQAMNQANRVSLGELIYHKSTLFERMKASYATQWGSPPPEDMWSAIVSKIPESGFWGWWDYELEVLPIVIDPAYAPTKSKSLTYQNEQQKKITDLARKSSQEAVDQAKTTVDQASAAALEQKNLADEAAKSKKTWQIVAGVAVVGAIVYFAMKKK